MNTGAQWLCLNTGSLTPLNFTRFKGIIKAFSGMCVRLTSITFPVIWSSVLISVAWVARLWAGHVFPNIKYRAKMFVYPVPKISQVMMKWCRRASHLGRFTLWYPGHLATQLSRFTLWYYGRLATQLSRFTLWHNRRWTSQLAGKFTLWHNARRAKKPGLMHAPGVARIFQEKYEGLIQSKFYSGCKLSTHVWKMNALEVALNTDR